MKGWQRNLLILLLLVFPALLVSLMYLEDVVETGGQELPNAIILTIVNIPRSVIDIASGAGYAGVFVLMLLESAAFPVPSEIILPLAGYLVSQGRLEFWLVVLYSTLAAVVGSFIDYFLGWKLGSSLLAEPSRIPYVSSKHLHRTHVWFNQHGPWAVAFLRMVPAARVLISFPAGAYRMNKTRFAAYTIAGCLPWNITLVYLGWFLGSNWEEVVAAFRYVNLAVYALLILLGVWIVWRFTSKRK